MEKTFCEKFNGGYCPIQRKGVPRSWCFARCDVTKEYPSLIEQGKSFAIASAKYVAAGRPNRSEDEIAVLVAICKKCFYYDANAKPHLQKKGPRCRECGCGINLKQMWETSNCRKGFWDKEQNEEIDFNSGDVVDNRL